MALLVLDSFDGYNTAKIGSRWSTSGGTIAAGRNGNGLQCASGDNPKNTLPTAYNTFTVGWAYRTGNFTGKPIKVSNHTTGLTVTVDHVGDGTLTVTPSIGSTSTASATIDKLGLNQFYYLELQVSATVAAGTMTLGYALYANQKNLVAGSASATWGGANGFDTYGLVGPSSSSCIIDDLYVATDDLLGNIRVLASFPTADGSTVAYTPSTGSSHYVLVNETSPDDDTTYNTGINNTDVELYTYPAVVADRVQGLQNVIRARKPSGALSAIKPYYKSGSKTFSGTLIQPTTSYVTYTEPHRKSVFTGVDWSTGEVTNMQAGSTVLANGYAWLRTFTIDHSKVGSANQTNYPVLILGTYSWLATVANGGLLLDATNGYDFNFYSDASGTVPLNYEIVFHDITTGDVELWVNVPTVSHTADTVFYCFYSWAGGTTNLSNSATWNSNYVAVHHFADSEVSGSNLASLNDSTPHAYNLDEVLPLVGGAISGKIREGAHLDGTHYGYVNLAMFDPGNVFPGGSDPRTMELWVKSTTAADGQTVFSYGSNIGSGSRFGLYCYLGSWALDTGNYGLSFGTIDNNWHHIVLAFPSGQTQVNQTLCFLDGVLQTPTVLANGTLATAVVDYLIGATPGTFSFSGPANKFTGDVDECRIHLVGATADYVTTSYNNQNDPTSFYSVGSQTGAPQVPTRITQQYLEIALASGGLGQGSLYTAH